MTDVLNQTAEVASPALEMIGISKAFGGNPVLDDVSLAVRWGEVHALLGENGAGKSTVMNIATGIYAADAGTIRVDGQPAAVRNPADATRFGLGMVHQHFRLVPGFTVAENILLACHRQQEHIRGIRAAAAAILEMGEKVRLTVDPHVQVRWLSIAERQRAEILKVLLLGARIVILDEPTAVLTDQESADVLSFVRMLAASGHAVILITHKLREVIGFSDRVTVMRRGKVVLGGADTGGLDAGMLARHMVGEQIPAVDAPAGKPGSVALQVSDLVVENPTGGVGIDGISLALRQGEILGLAGVGGNGQQQLTEALMGLQAPRAGMIRLDGTDITRSNVRKRRSLGLRTIPSDRYGVGLIADMSVAENLALTRVRTGAHDGVLGLSRNSMRAVADRAIEAYAIAGAAPDISTRMLSGGNAQKLVLARELEGDVVVLVAHSPTRGLDVRACNVVHTLIKTAVENGAACLLISEDLDEILMLSTRVAVLSRGRIADEFAPGEASPERIGRAILGHA